MHRALADAQVRLFRACLDDGEVLQLLHVAAQYFAQGRAPAEVSYVSTLVGTTGPPKKKTEGSGKSQQGPRSDDSSPRLLLGSFGGKWREFVLYSSLRCQLGRVGHGVRAAIDRDAKALAQCFVEQVVRGREFARYDSLRQDGIPSFRVAIGKMNKGAVAKYVNMKQGDPLSEEFVESVRR